MGPYENVSNIKNIISKPLDNKTIRNTHNTITVRKKNDESQEQELSDFNTTGDPDYSHYDLGDAEKANTDFSSYSWGANKIKKEKEQ